MNFLDMQNEVKDLINFTAAADADFTDAKVKGAINARYKHEVVQAKQHGSRDWFRTKQAFTWPGSTVSITLPSGLERGDLVLFEDCTTTDPGVPLIFDSFGHAGDVHWLDHRKLQWGTSGPGSDRTLKVTYLAQAELLVDDEQEPLLIQPEHRMLLVWSAACYLRLKADERIPDDWKTAYREHQMDYWKAVSRGRPSANNEPTVKSTDFSSAVFPV